MSKNVQNNDVSKIYINMDNKVLEVLDYMAAHGTSYGLVKPTRKALIESLIVREYSKIQREQLDIRKFNMELEDRGITYHDD